MIAPRVKPAPRARWIATVAAMALAGVPPDDPTATSAELIDVCGADPGIVCEEVWDATDNETLAKLADWVIGRPLTILLILLVAWLVSRFGRRIVRRSVARVVASDTDVASRTLRRVGVNPPAALGVVRDPRRESRARSISAVVASIVTVAVWVIALILIVGELGVDLAPLIAGAGIAGVALGFGAQSIVKDCLTGLFMLVEDQFGIGDVVDLGEAVGVVERITLRSTVLRGMDGTVWHVPNGEVRRVGNRSQLWSVAVLDVLVTYDSDLAVARRVLAETATAVCESTEFADDVLEPPEVTGVEALGTDGVALRVLVKTKPGSQFAIQRELRAAVKTAFDRAGVDMPFPPRAMWGQGTPDAPDAPPSDPPT